MPAKTILLELLRSPPVDVQFSINGKIITPLFKVGHYKIILNGTQSNGRLGPCILVEIMTDTVHLEDYYFEANKNTTVCPQLSHANVFELLDVLSSVLKYDQSLLDVSTKKVSDQCTLYMETMSIAKGKTFYNGYGFMNDDIDAFIAKSRNMLLKDFNFELNKKFKTLEPQLDSSTLKDTALWILDKCEKNKTTEEIKSFIRGFSIALGNEFPMSEFVKQYKRVAYNVTVRDNDGVTQVAFTLSPKKSQQQTINRRKKHRRVSRRVRHKLRVYKVPRKDAD